MNDRHIIKKAQKIPKYITTKGMTLNEIWLKTNKQKSPVIFSRHLGKFSMNRILDGILDS